MSTPMNHRPDPPETHSVQPRTTQPPDQTLTLLDSMQSYAESFMKETNKLREQMLQTERHGNETKRLNQKLETANKELYMARKDAAVAHAVSEARLQQTIKLQKERDNARAEAKKLRRASEMVDAERAKAENLRGVVRELELKCETLRTERSSVLTERDELKIKLDTKQKLIEEYANLLQTATAQQYVEKHSEEQHASTKRSLKDAQRTCDKLQHKLTRQKTSYETQMTQLRSELDAANSELREAERFKQKLDTLPKRKEMLKLAVLIQQRKDLLRKRVCFNCGTHDGSSPSSASSEAVEVGCQLARQALSSSSYHHASLFGELSSDDASTDSFAPGDNQSPVSDAGYCAESPEDGDGSDVRDAYASPEEPDVIWEPSPSVACIASTSSSSARADFILNRTRKRKSEEPWPGNYA